MPKRSHKELHEIHDRFYLASCEALSLIDDDLKSLAQKNPSAHNWPWANVEETEPILILASQETVKFIIEARYGYVDTGFRSVVVGSKIKSLAEIKKIITPKGWVFPDYVAPNGVSYPLCFGDKTSFNYIIFPIAVASIPDGKLKPVRVIKQK